MGRRQAGRKGSGGASRRRAKGARKEPGHTRLFCEEHRGVPPRHEASPVCHCVPSIPSLNKRWLLPGPRFYARETLPSWGS